ncbi:MAG: hypothetical protein PVJ42_05160 [bacterium]|jgi:hypothetical protein
MADEPGFDVKAAHKFFAADCFNRTWGLMEKSDRTSEDDEQMLLLTFASQWHWSQREDCAPTNVSVGYWQISRVFAILGQADNARRYGHLSLEALKDETGLPFYFGYAYEALARAEMVAGDKARMDEYLAKAREFADKVPYPDSKKLLTDDLGTIA